MSSVESQNVSSPDDLVHQDLPQYGVVPTSASPGYYQDHGQEWYVKEFLAEIDRRIPHLNNFRRQETEDFRSYMCLWLLERSHLMNSYHPRVLVATCIRQRAIDFYRSMARQLPQGRFDKAVGGLTKPLVWLDSLPSATSTDATVVTESCEVQVVHSMMLGALMTTLSPRQKQVFELVDLNGLTVVQAARVLGVRREFAQRALGQARRTMRSRPMNSY